MSEALDSLHPTLRELPGKTIVGRYKVDEALGVGGMGAVFRGHHLGLKRDVAIKVLHPDLTRDPEISKRFDREAHSASRLDHPNCLRVTDVGSTDDGVKFMVMDLLSGAELADRMGEPIVAERALLMMLQVLRGLEHAHEHGVIHRDIKPENIFVTRDHDGREILKLVDFGIAKLVGGGTNDTRMTKAGLIFGTPAYMSPEQAMGMEADARADLYAVGVILYEMLTGDPPFESDDPVKLVRMQVSKDPPPLPDDVAPALGAVVLKLLDKDRDERYQTATATREALEQVLPSIASSDIISGVTILGSTTSGPVLISPSTSMPIPLAAASSSAHPMATSTSSSSAHPMATAPTERSGAFSPSSLPTLPPGGGAMMSRPRSKLPLIGGAVVVVLGLAAWLASGDDKAGGGGSGEDGIAIVGDDDDEGPAPPADDEGSFPIIEDGPDEDRLVELDRLIYANKLTEAQQMLDPMLDDYPKSAALAWRQGRIFRNKRRSKSKNKPRALTAYGNALDAAPGLLDDQKFFAELSQLLTENNRYEALDFALRKMGRSGHAYLLGLVNNEDRPLRYEDRHRALEELLTDEANVPLVDSRRHQALDLLQAEEWAFTPCTAYHEALEVIATSPDYWFLARVQSAKIPKPKTGDTLSEEQKADAEKCVGLEARRDEVIAQLEELAPPEEGTGGELDKEPADEGGESKESGSKEGGSKGSGSKGSGSGSKGSGSKKKKNCSRVEKLLNPSKCR